MALAEDDALIVCDDTADAPRFVVHSYRGPQLVCRTFAEAEAHALAYTERARTHAWYRNGRGFQLVLKRGFPFSSSGTRRPT